jgi:flagellar biosynthesis/type III secretory pathway protein FliH
VSNKTESKNIRKQEGRKEGRKEGKKEGRKENTSYTGFLTFLTLPYVAYM